MSNNPTVRITQINPLSSHDGSGVRTTLFMKGCSLRCAWCHNPETRQMGEQIMWKRNLCIGCGNCMEHCPTQALHLSDAVEFLDASRCVACGTCVEHCPSEALRRASQSYTLQEVTAIIQKNKPLFTAMGGGVTFSGGEPALQAPFLAQVMAHDRTLHYALDTCGEAPFSAYEQLLPHLDQLLFDLKEMSPQKHRAFTGAENHRILENLQRIILTIQEKNLPTKIWIRTPLIPHLTATQENVESIARFIATLPESIVERWEMCSFNNMCKDKYRQLGIRWSLEEEELLTSDEAAAFLAQAQAILPEHMVRVTGLTLRK